MVVAHSETVSDLSSAIVIFDSLLEGDVSLRLIEFEDGHFSILRNGKALCEQRWAAGELESCIDLYRRLQRGGEVVESLLPGHSGNGAHRKARAG